MKQSLLNTKAVSVDEIKASYDRDYKDRKFGGPDYTHRWIMKLLRPGKGGRLLDIGCGQGRLLAEAWRWGLLTAGIDLSSEAAGLARQNAPFSEIVCGDGHKLSQWQDGEFDYVTAIGTIEHFTDPEACLGEMRRVMKPDGRACIMLPNQYYYGYIIDRILWKKEPTSYQQIERFASLSEWKKMIEDNGFCVERMHKYNKFNRPKAMILFRSMTIPLALSHHIVFICRTSKA
jgi:ubiquinone/menaquinone biosynthesis C-methylase UbiE